MISFSHLKPVGEVLSLASKRAIVTGGARGIGLAISYRLAEAGASVLIADVDAKAAEEACLAFKDCGKKPIAVQCDISVEGDVRMMVDFAVDNMGGIDILVNNAGIYPRKPLAETSAADLERVMGINLKGTFLCSREAARNMTKQNTGGSIINIVSIGAVHPSRDGLAAYESSKGAVLTMTKSLALELAPNDIRVNAIAPGGILTEGVMTGGYDATSAQGKAQLKAFMARMPLGRMGRPDDVAGVALFLASSLADYMTGTVITVDGGFLIS
jgi:2-dehydro-3-deoxy-D-gluconate 5-dehydrogenase